MFISLVILYKALLKNNSAKPQPIYHKTWKEEVEGYPASSYAKSLEMVVH